MHLNSNIAEKLMAHKRMYVGIPILAIMRIRK